MNIDRNEIIAGLPAVEARDLIAKLIWIHSGFTLNDLAKRLKIKKPIAHKYVEAFESEGYLKPFDGQDSKKRWVTTIKGNALAQASAAKRFKRATADKHYDLFLKRVSEINSNAKFLYQVSKVAVFGSYLTNSPTVGDIDLFVWIELKKEFSEQFPQIHEQRTKEMEAEGRRFRSLEDQLSWPQLDVRKHLKNGSRVISIQAINDGFTHFDCEVVFDINSNISGEKRGTLED